uniref:Uncharacterized protein n=1 Tax=Cyanothece sp. (strain PCC 7425 / ATCC 29141) TaxID=395961 RepID=B8HP60_CYAP4
MTATPHLSDRPQDAKNSERANPHPSATEPGAVQLAQQLLEQLTIHSQDWHRLKANRKARALEQAAAAMVFLLKDQPQEALERLQQASGWLDRSITAPPCPSHGHSPPQHHSPK